MAFTTVSATLKLDNTLSPPQAIVNDTTDYAGQLVPVADCNGYIKLEVETASGPLTIYDNIGGTTPDIIPSAGLTNNIPIVLPLDTDGKIVQGDYTLTYQVVYLNSGDPTDPPSATITKVNEYSFNLTEPEICVTVAVNCAASTVTSTDATEYGTYVSNIASTHTIYPDPLLHIINKVGSVSKLIYNNIGTGHWASEVISIVTWTFTDGLMYVDELTGCKEYDIECNTDLCKLFCCLKSAVDNWALLKQSGQLTEADRIYETKLKPAFIYAELFLLAMNCGKGQDSLDTLFDLVKTNSGCSPDCCDDDCPTLIIPTTSSNSGDVIVDSPDNTVTVTEEVIDGTTYYHLHVTIPPQEKVSVVGTDPIVVTSAVDGKGKTVYTVSLSVALPVQINEIDIMGVIASSGSTWTWTPNYVVRKGSNTIDPAVTPYTYYLGSNEPTNPSATDIVALHVSGYQVAPGKYTAQANIMSAYPNDTVASIKTKLASLKTMEAEIMYVDPTFASDDFFVRICSIIDGHPIKFGELLDTLDRPVGMLVRIQIILLTT